MKRYGLRIGDVGIEFPSIEERDKALKCFTHGVDVRINTFGLKYEDGDGSFSVYDRDSKEVITICCICKGSFGIETCNNKSYPYKNSWEKEFGEKEGYICSACFASQIKAQEVFNAKKVLGNSEEE